MIYSVTKNSSHTISRVALNNQGGILDLTGATITIVAKLWGNTATLFTKTSESTSEVEIVDIARGLFLYKIGSANTSSLNYRSLYCLQTILIGTTTYSDVFYIRLRGVNQTMSASSAYLTAGTTAQRPTLGVSDAGFEYYDTTQQTPVWWSGTAWSDA